MSSQSPAAIHLQILLDAEKERVAELEAKVEELEGLLKKAKIFIDDVLPQIGGICLQDYGNLNDLCIGLTKLIGEDDE